METGQSHAKLEGVAETLLIPLAARVLAPRINADLGFCDPYAKRIASQLDFDPRRFADDKASMRGSIVRAIWFDRVVSLFFERHPEGLCVSIGSGLDWRSERIRLPVNASWCDVELPDVADLRCRLVAPCKQVKTIPADGSDLMEWISSVPWPAGRPALVIAEGVFMYLTPDRASRILTDLVAASGARGDLLELAFDFASPLMVRNSRANRSVAKTSAQFQWSVRRPADLERSAPGLKLVEEADLVSDCGAFPAMMGMIHRLITFGRPLYGGAHFRVEMPERNFDPI